MKAINVSQPQVKGRVIIRIDFESGASPRFADALHKALLRLKIDIGCEAEDFEAKVHQGGCVVVEVAPWVHDAYLPEKIRQVVLHTEVLGG